jgi:hypothetical protein
MPAATFRGDPQETLTDPFPGEAVTFCGALGVAEGVVATPVDAGPVILPVVVAETVI